MGVSVPLGDRLTLTRLAARGGQIFRLEGIIDETFDRVTLLEKAGGLLVFDLDAVTRITSYGVREWIGALKQIPGDYYFVNCRPTMVTQFNLVANFAGTGRLITFYAPYLCPSCEKTFDQKIDLRVHHELVRQHQSPAARCPDCGGEATLDDLPESYFAYAADRGAAVLPPHVNALLDGDASGLVTSFRVEKRIEGSVTVLKLRGNLDKAGTFRRVGDGLEGIVLLDLSDLTQAGPDGLAGLARLTETPHTTFFAAGAGLPLLAAIASTRDKLGKAKLCSARLPFACPSCKKHQDVDVHVPELSLWLQGMPLQQPCESCEVPMTPGFSSAELAPLAAFERAEPPDEVLHCLRDAPLELEPAAPPSGPFSAGPPGAPLEKYQPIKRLGAGGMAEVFLADQIGPMGFKKKVVLKRILPHLAADHAFTHMLLEEARLAARISHPNVVQIFDLGASGAEYFIAMEYVPGCDLLQVLKAAATKQRAIPIGMACHIVSQICGGLHSAHSCTDEEGAATPILHRDVTPQNVLISHEGVVKLTDFGIAKAAGSATNTNPGTLKGTLSYVAPELIRNEPGDARADVFSAGVILYQCLTLEQPFKRDTEMATMHALLEGEVVRPSAKRPDVPAELEAAILRAMARDPAARFQTAQALGDALTQAMAARGQVFSSSQLAAWLSDLLDGAPLARVAELTRISRASDVEALSTPATPSGGATRRS